MIATLLLSEDSARVGAPGAAAVPRSSAAVGVSSGPPALAKLIRVSDAASRLIGVEPQRSGDAAVELRDGRHRNGNVSKRNVRDCKGRTYCLPVMEEC